MSGKQTTNGVTIVMDEPRESHTMQFFKKWLGLHEFVTLDTYRSGFAEFFGTAYKLFLLFCCLAGLEFNDTWKQGGAVTAVFCGICMVTGMIWIIFHLSGSNMNPALSISFALNGLITCARAIIYIPFQLAGAIVAAALTKALMPDDFTGWHMCTHKWERTSVAQAYIFELLGTALLAIVYLACVDVRLRHPEKGISGQFGQGPFHAALVVGGILFGITPFSGGSINPARSFGPAVIFGYWDNHWIYWAAPIPGAILGAAFYRFLLHHKWEMKSCRARRVVRVTESGAEVEVPNDELPIEDTCFGQWCFWRHHHIDE